MTENEPFSKTEHPDHQSEKLESSIEPTDSADPTDVNLQFPGGSLRMPGKVFGSFMALLAPYVGKAILLAALSYFLKSLVGAFR